MPAAAMERWGFVVIAFCTPSHRKIAERLKRSLEHFDLPYSIQVFEFRGYHDMTADIHHISRGWDFGWISLQFRTAMLQLFHLQILIRRCNLIYIEP